MDTTHNWNIWGWTNLAQNGAENAGWFVPSQLATLATTETKCKELDSCHQFQTPAVKAGPTQSVAADSANK